MKVSVVIITLNNTRTIKQVLAAVAGWADEIVVVDSGSIDETLAIAQQFGCKTLYRKFDGFGKQKHFAVEQAKNDWIFIVDADEVVSPELKIEIDEVLKNAEYQGFMVPNTLIFLGEMMRFGREYKMPHLRLFNRKFGNYNDRQVHEDIVLNGKTMTLKNHVLHHSYADLAECFQKINNYSSRGASELQKRGKKASLLKIITKFPITFITEYFIRLNFLNGYRGFVWAFSQAVYATLKYLKLRELSILNE
ncbi:glycosyltransferase family 2 protein [Emticicia sp.]|uniref:glycosyltransferase family 2 protein n=1 Tax=Emticicia sp. TaxID=1930953 RepID=UPI003752F8BD